MKFQLKNLTALHMAEFNAARESLNNTASAGWGACIQGDLMVARGEIIYN